MFNLHQYHIVSVLEPGWEVVITGVNDLCSFSLRLRTRIIAGWANIGGHSWSITFSLANDRGLISCHHVDMNYWRAIKFAKLEYSTSTLTWTSPTPWVKLRSSCESSVATNIHDEQNIPLTITNVQCSQGSHRFGAWARMRIRNPWGNWYVFSLPATTHRNHCWLSIREWPLTIDDVLTRTCGILSQCNARHVSRNKHALPRRMNEG